MLLIIAAESLDCSISATKTVELSEDMSDTSEFSEQHLQEEENGQNKRKMQSSVHNKMTSSKRGKYLRICPNVILMHNCPFRKRKDMIIQNGNLLAPVKVDKTKIQVVNTCPFDLLIELIGYSDTST